MLKRFVVVSFLVVSVFQIVALANAGQTEEERTALVKKLHDQEVASAKTAWDIVLGKKDSIGEEAEPDWVGEAKSGKQDAVFATIMTACDDYWRFQKGKYLEELFAGVYTQKVEVHEVLDKLTLPVVHSVVEKLGLQVASGMLATMKAQGKSVYCGIGEGAFDLGTFTAFDSMVEVLKYLKKEPKNIKTTPEELRGLLLKAVRKETIELASRLADSEDARGVVNGFLEEYNFTPEELGLSPAQQQDLEEATKQQ